MPAPSILPVKDIAIPAEIFLSRAMAACQDYQGMAPMLRLQNAQAVLDAYVQGSKSYGQTYTALRFEARPAPEGMDATWTAIHAIRGVLSLVELTVHSDHVIPD